MSLSSQRWIVAPREPVLVTGANGFIGARVVKTLLDYGFHDIRCLVRQSGNRMRLDQVISGHGAAGAAARIVNGNLLSPDDCVRAASDAAVVFHLAAGVEKSFAGCFMNSVVSTRNLLDATLKSGTLRRFVNVSSFAVYSRLEARRGALLTEQSPLEDAPQRRNDPYGYGKLKQEEIVERYHKSFGIPYVVLRPGAVYGPGKPNISGRVGIDTFGVFLHMGGTKLVPFTYVDNCAEAIVLAGITPGVDGEVFNVVDDDLPSSRRFLRLYKQRVRRFMTIPIPYPIAYFFSAAWEDYAIRSQGQLPARFNRRRCAAEWKAQVYSNGKLRQRLGWTPRVSFDEGFRLLFDSIRGIN